jgi:hypothetical protein
VVAIRGEDRAVDDPALECAPELVLLGSSRSRPGPETVPIDDPLRDERESDTGGAGWAHPSRTGPATMESATSASVTKLPRDPGRRGARRRAHRPDETGRPSGNPRSSPGRRKDAMMGVLMLTSIVALLHVLVWATND